MADTSPIRPIGSLLTTDADGFLVSQSSPDNIVPPWAALVDEIRDAYVEHAGNRLHSMYVRGSVARGTAIEGIADVDTLTLVHGDPQDLDDSWFGPFRDDMAGRYPFSQGIEMAYRSLDRTLSEPDLSHARFLIKTQCACLYGESIIPHLPPVRPGLDAVVHAPRIAGEIDGVLRELGDPDGDSVRDLCGWIMKRLVRTGFELVMEREQAFTRDLYPCWKSFSRYYPDKSEPMFQALEWCIEPTDDTDRIAALLGELGPWLGGEVDRTLTKRLA